VAQITYQSLFKLYPKLSGMTGTAKTEVKIYIVPTLHSSLTSNLFFYQFMMAVYIVAGERVLKNVSDASH